MRIIWEMKFEVPTNDPVLFITPWYEGSSSTAYGFGTSWPAPFFQGIPNANKFPSEWTWPLYPDPFPASGQPTWISRHAISK